MPVYEYECQACHREFEYQQRMSDPDKSICESCGGSLDRLISRTAFALKGSGWHKDLYSSEKPAAASYGTEAGCGPSEGAACAPSGPSSSADACGCDPSSCGPGSVAFKAS